MGKSWNWLDFFIFLAYFGPCKKQLSALKIEPLDGIGRNFKCSKEKKFLTIAEKDSPMENHLGCKKMQKPGGRFTWHGLYTSTVWEYITNLGYLKPRMLHTGRDKKILNLLFGLFS